MSTALATTKKPNTLPQPQWRRKMPGLVIQGTRRRFLEAYEKHCGNITAASMEVGIQRRTYYRWLASKSRINERFKKALALIRPEERQADMFEIAHTQLVGKLDPAAVIFGLKTKGRNRGWNEREFIVKNEVEIAELEQLRAKIADRAKQKGISFGEELGNYMAIFGSTLAPAISEQLAKELK